MSMSQKGIIVAPPAGYLPMIKGYELLKLGEAWIPSAPQSERESRVLKPPLSIALDASIDDLTVKEAEEALEMYVGGNWCYGTAPLRDLQVLSTRSSQAFHVNLDTYVERRKFEFAVRPHKQHGVSAASAAAAAPIPTPDYSGVAAPWAVAAEMPALFEDGQVGPADVPGTLTVKDCFHCDGGGQLRCGQCEGAGINVCAACRGAKKKVCDPCKGKGYAYRSNAPNVADDCRACRGLGFQHCAPCKGRGDLPCVPCSGRGDFACAACKGHGLLEIAVAMTVTWRTEHVSRVTGQPLPQSLLPAAAPRPPRRRPNSLSSPTSSATGSSASISSAASAAPGGAAAAVVGGRGASGGSAPAKRGSPSGAAVARASSASASGAGRMQQSAVGAVPPELLKHERGELIAEAPRGPLVPPLTSPSFPAFVAELSAEMVAASHAAAGRIVIQAHNISRVPLWQVTAKFTMDNKKFIYFVYGDQHLVYETDYPSPYCCGLGYSCVVA
ncbi:unnamed protein product [Phaeothamnion confervicola]